MNPHVEKNALLISFICISILFCKVSRAQEKETVVDKDFNFPTTFFNKVNSKYSNMEDRLTKQTQKYLQRLAKKEKKMKRRLVKKTKLQLLFDFLSYQQTPRTQPIKFRVGYNF